MALLPPTVPLEVHNLSTVFTTTPTQHLLILVAGLHPVLHNETLASEAGGLESKLSLSVKTSPCSVSD